MVKVKTHYEDCDVLVVGGGMAGTGAAFEARHWGRDLKIICVEKANIDRSGAVAQGLYAEPEGLNIDGELPSVPKDSFKKGVYY